MKKFFAVLMVLTLLTTVFPFTMVEAKSKTVSLTGEIVKVSPENSRNEVLALKCEGGNYVLAGNTKGMKEYINCVATVNGTIYSVPKGIAIFKVKDFKIVDKPTPTPVQTMRPVETPMPMETPTPAGTPTLDHTAIPEPVVTQVPAKQIEIKGTLFNSDSSKVRFLLKTENGIYELMGNTKGMENEFGNILLVKGNYVYTFAPTEYPLFSVESYTVLQGNEPMPTPVVTSVPAKQIEIKGTLFNSDSSKVRFLLKTENGIYELMGNTKGMENEYGNILLIKGNYVYTFAPTEYPLFSVESYTVLQGNEPIPTPVVTSVPTAKTITIEDNGGYVYVYPGDEVKLELEANHSTPYDWSYVTKPDQDILLQTNYEYQEYELYDPEGYPLVGSGGKGIWTYKALKSGTALIEMAYIPRSGEPVEPVKTFTVKVIVEELQTVQGSLKVTKLDSGTEDNSVSYEYLLNTQSGPVTLQGNTKGLENYDGFDIVASGRYSLLKIYPPIFIVDSYKPLSTPSPAVKTITMADNGGYVYIKNGDEVKLELETNPTTGYDWSYITKPDQNVLLETNYEYIPDDTTGMKDGSGGKGVWTYKAIKSGTVVIEMAYSRPWESVSPAKTFIVKVIIEETATPTPTVIPVPTVKPEPTPVPSSKTHTIISDKALYINIPDIQFTEATGFTTISWTAGTDKAFFNSKLNLGKDIYEFELVCAKASDSESIKGVFNIKKNGELVVKEIAGQLSGLSQPVGSYIKFYSEDMKYHMSTYITSRLDF